MEKQQLLDFIDYLISFPMPAGLDIEGPPEQGFHRLVIIGEASGMQIVGPPADEKEQAKEGMAFINQDPTTCLSLLLDLIVDPKYMPSPDPNPFDYAVDMLLTLSIQRDPQAFIQEAGPLLWGEHLPAASRAALLGAINSACWEREDRLPEGIDWLRPLVERSEELTDNELSWVACTVGDIGKNTDRKAEAREWLQRLQAKVPSHYTATHEQIALYLPGS